ncbi:hypothetical protein [Kitasatospora sp. NPDC050543]|uniref:hypothetical protein n=1 Tax=Kitasatospora sp. NPDC050543 TaxID=3364054 RepID=UPI00379D727A
MLTTTPYISPDTLLWLIVPATALLLGRMVFVSVRWLRADTETRISLGQARRIRRTWKRLAPMAELAAKDSTPTGLEHLNTDGKAVKPKIRTPGSPPRPTSSASPSPPPPCPASASTPGRTPPTTCATAGA